MDRFVKVLHRSCLVLLFAFAATQANAQLYRVESLGSLGGNGSTATAINSLGRVAGYSTTASGRERAFLWTNGTMQELPPLPGDTDSRAVGINEQGKVVGMSWRGSFSSAALNGVLWAPGYARKLVAAGGTSVEITGINNAGVISGAVKAGSRWKAILWTPEGVRELPGLSKAVAVNERDDIAATMELERSGYLGWLWRNGAATEIGRETVIDGSTPDDIIPVALNIRGQLAITFWPIDGPPTARRWTDSVSLSLGDLGGGWAFSHGMNDSGDVVGSSLNDRVRVHAFLYRDGGGLVDLNTKLPPGSGWELTDARAINNRGQIAGAGTHNGQQQAFLLTPIWTRPGVLWK